MYVDRYLIKSASSVYNFNVDPVSLSQWRYNWKSMISHILHFSHPSILCWQCVDICAGTMYLHTVHTRARMHINVSAAHMSTSTLAPVLRGRNNQCCFTQCWCRGGTSVLTLTILSCRDMHRINLYCHLLLIETKWHETRPSWGHGSVEEEHKIFTGTICHNIRVLQQSWAEGASCWGRGDGCHHLHNIWTHPWLWLLGESKKVENRKITGRMQYSFYLGCAMWWKEQTSDLDMKQWTETRPWRPRWDGAASCCCTCCRPPPCPRPWPRWGASASTRPTLT